MPENFLAWQHLVIKRGKCCGRTALDSSIKNIFFLQRSKNRHQMICRQVEGYDSFIWKDKVPTSISFLLNPSVLCCHAWTHTPRVVVLASLQVRRRLGTACPISGKRHALFRADQPVTAFLPHRYSDLPCPQSSWSVSHHASMFVTVRPYAFLRLTRLSTN